MPPVRRSGIDTPLLFATIGIAAARPYRFALWLGIAAAALAILSPPAMAGCNSGNVGASVLLSSAGCQATATADFAIAVGTSAQALGRASTAVGAYSHASVGDSTAIGVRATARAARVTAVGAFAGSGQPRVGETSIGYDAGSQGTAGTYSVGVGAFVRPFADYSIAIGAGDGSLLNGLRFQAASAPGYGGVAIGVSAMANNQAAVAVGPFAVADGFLGVALGDFSRAAGNRSVALGRESKANANFSLALGAGSVTGGVQSVALGYLSQATVTYGVALGPNAQATQVRAVALGSGSVANIANTVSVGSDAIKRRIVNVAPAVAANDAVTLGQVQALVRAAAEAKPSAAAFGDGDGHILDELRRELKELRALVAEQRQEIAALKGQTRLAATPTNMRSSAAISP